MTFGVPLLSLSTLTGVGQAVGASGVGALAAAGAVAQVVPTADTFGALVGDSQLSGAFEQLISRQLGEALTDEINVALPGVLDDVVETFEDLSGDGRLVAVVDKEQLALLEELPLLSGRESQLLLDNDVAVANVDLNAVLGHENKENVAAYVAPLAPVVAKEIVVGAPVVVKAAPVVARSAPVAAISPQQPSVPKEVVPATLQVTKAALEQAREFARPAEDLDAQKSEIVNAPAKTAARDVLAPLQDAGRPAAEVASLENALKRLAKVPVAGEQLALVKPQVAEVNTQPNQGVQQLSSLNSQGAANHVVVGVQPDGQSGFDSQQQNGGQQSGSGPSAPVAAITGGVDTASSMARADFAAHLASSQPTNAAPDEQVAVQVKHAVQQGLSKVTINLEPAHLGKVEVQLDIRADGATQVRVLVERAETLDLLQRDARGLERALADAGIKTGGSDLEFNLRDQSSAWQQAGQQQGKSGGRAGASDDQILAELSGDGHASKAAGMVEYVTDKAVNIIV